MSRALASCVQSQRRGIPHKAGHMTLKLRAPETACFTRAVLLSTTFASLPRSDQMTDEANISQGSRARNFPISFYLILTIPASYQVSFIWSCI